MSEPTIDEEAIERFESAWEDSEPTIEEFVPESSSPVRLATLAELVIIDLEFRWKRHPTSVDNADPGPGIEAYADRYPELRTERIYDQLVEEEFCIRRKYGDGPSCESFVVRFPHLEARLNELHEKFPINESWRANSNGDRVTPTVEQFTLIREIGEGGMGTVYLARQEEPVRRQVAIKVIRAGLDSREVIARFEAERQALAMMDHPNIARVYEAGTTDQGQPYFAMEYAEGVPLTDYCSHHRLGVPQRLAIFNDVCAAVQHAHQKGILHRDLKPSNVLITEEEGQPVAKVIDFGLAKAVDSTELLTDKTVFTHAGQVLGTLKYMSPEQAATHEKDVDTRADVYALGVILYELLTGATPLDENALREQGVLSILEMIRDHEPARPSSRLSGDQTASENISSERATSSTALQQVLRGDLDWIVMKAIEKDRNRRYDSASSLADDVKRFLSDEPVIARPPSASYRLQKFAKKNRTIVISTCAMFLLLVAGVAGTSWQANRAGKAESDALEQKRIAEARALDAEDRRKEADSLRKREAAARLESEAARDKALESTQRMKDVLGVVVGSFDAANPLNGAKKDMLAREVLVHARRQTQKRLENDPLGQATLYSALSRSFEGLGEFPDAIRSARAALKIRTRELGEQHNETVHSMQELLNSLNSNGQFKEAMQLAERVLEIRMATVPQNLDDLAAARNNLAAMQVSQGMYSDAIVNLDASLKLMRQDPKAKVSARISVASNLAYVHQQNGSPQEALEILEPLLDECRNALGETAPITFSVMGHLGLCYSSVEQFDDAVDVHQKCHDLATETLGDVHPTTLNTMLNLATALGEAGRVDDAIEMLTTNIESFAQKLKPEHPSVLVAKNNLASIYQDNNASEKSVVLNEEVLAIRKRVLRENHPRTLGTMNNLAIDYLNLERFQDADDLLTDALKRSEATLGPDAPLTAALRFRLATACDKTDSKRAIRFWEAIEEQRPGSDDHHLLVLRNLSRAYRRENRLDDAIRTYTEAIETQIGSNVAVVSLRSELASTQMQNGRPDQALPQLVAALNIMEQNERYDKQTYRLFRDIVVCHLWLRQFESAEAVSQRLISWLENQNKVQTSEYAFALASLASACSGQPDQSETTVEAAKRALEHSDIGALDRWRARMILATQTDISDNSQQTALPALASELLAATPDETDVPSVALVLLNCDRMVTLTQKLNLESLQQQWTQKKTDVEETR